MYFSFLLEVLLQSILIYFKIALIIRTAWISYALDSIQAESAKFLINENRLKWDLRSSNKIKSNISCLTKVKTNNRP
jgi:hypothetical protein